MTSIALAEELLLLGYDDRTGKATGSRIGLDLAMAAAVLVDLALVGRIAYGDGSLVALDSTPTGDPIADEILARLVADTPHTPAQWLQRLRHGLRDRVLADLVSRGVMRDEDETALGVIHLHRYPSADRAPELEVRARLTQALTGESEPDERTAALATLIVTARMELALGLTGEAAKEAHKRLEEIANSAGFAGVVDLENSTVRPSVALVIATLTRAINAALGAPRA